MMKMRSLFLKTVIIQKRKGNKSPLDITFRYDIKALNDGCLVQTLMTKSIKRLK